jgi:hypothetical protein
MFTLIEFIYNKLEKILFPITNISQQDYTYFRLYSSAFFFNPFIIGPTFHIISVIKPSPNLP